MTCWDFAALGLLDDADLSNYGKISADSDYELSDGQQSQGEYNSNLISGSEKDSSHADQFVHTKQCLSVADVFTEIVKVIKQQFEFTYYLANYDTY